MEKLSKQTYRILHTLLQYFRQEETTSSPEEINSLWHKIQLEVMRQKQLKYRHIFWRTTSVAAVVALLFAAGWWKTMNFDLENKSFNWLEQYAVWNDTASAMSYNNDIELRLADGKKIRVGTKQDIIYTPDNYILIGNDTVYHQTCQLSSHKMIVDEIVTPAGKQAKIQLADGTKIWINADTRVIYPHQFEKRRREIFVNGEAYLEVTHNDQAPFYVKTPQFELQVLGTKFNVASYSSEDYSSVVLVEGSVKVENREQDHVILTPNQYVQIQNGQIATPIIVDVRKYISWTKDLLIYEEEDLQKVLNRLGTYYRKKFIIDGSTKDILISGKLELKDSLDKVLRALSFSFPISFETKGDSIWVTSTKNN